MTISTLNSTFNFRRQLTVVLKTYLTRWEFYLVLSLCFVLSTQWRHSSARNLRPPNTITVQQYEIGTGIGMPISAVSPTPSQKMDLIFEEKNVSLSGSHIDDETIARLTQFPQVESVSLYGTAITDRGISLLAELPNLKIIWIYGTVASGTGFKAFGNSAQLSGLDFSRSHLSPAGVAAISKLNSVRWLRLEGANLDESALKPLASMSKLRSIDLTLTRISEAAVGWLAKLQELQSVNVAHTFISKNGVRKLRRVIPGVRVIGVNSLEKRSTPSQVQEFVMKQDERRRGDQLLPLVLPSIILGVWLGVQLKLQFAAPRSRMVPGFAKAHLVAPGCLFLLVATPSTLIAYANPGISVLSAFAIQTAVFAWCLWLAHRNSVLMLFSAFGGVGLIAFAPPSIHTMLLDSFVPASPTLPSMLLLFAGLAGLFAYAARLTRFHEAMSEYGMVFSFDMAWDLASRSANRRRQQMEANAISKSVVNAWLLDRQFDFAMRHLPNSWLPRAVGLLQISHGLAAFWGIPMLVLMSGGIVWLSGALQLTNSIVPFVPIYMTAMVPMMSMSMLNGQWLQHWRWFSSELLRPQTRRRYVSSILAAIAVDGAIAIAVPVTLVTVFVLRGWTVGEFSSLQTWLLCAVHIFANIVTTVPVVAWLTSYRRAWVSILVMTAALFAHGGLTALSLELGPAWIPVVLPAVFVAAIVAAILTMIIAARRWNSIEFA